MDKNLPAMWENQAWVRKTPWRREWQAIPVFLPGESHGQRSWRATVHGVTQSQTQLSANIFTFIRITLLGWDFFEKYHAAIFFSQKEEIFIILKLYSAHFTWQYWKPFNALNSFEPEIN